MNYVELYIKSVKKIQAQSIPVPASSQQYNLPGLKTYKQYEEEQIFRFKREYNLELKSYQNGQKKLKSLKGERRKEMKQQLASTKDNMESLLNKIRAYSPTEKAMGFEGVDDAK